MTYDFPASVHRDDYANSLIAIDIDDYRRLYAQGWRLSHHFLSGSDDPLITEKKPRGRPRKNNDDQAASSSDPDH